MSSLCNLQSRLARIKGTSAQEEKMSGIGREQGDVTPFVLKLLFEQYNK